MSHAIEHLDVLWNPVVMRRWAHWHRRQQQMLLRWLRAVDLWDTDSVVPYLKLAKGETSSFWIPLLKRYWSEASWRHLDCLLIDVSPRHGKGMVGWVCQTRQGDIGWSYVPLTTASGNDPTSKPDWWNGPVWETGWIATSPEISTDPWTTLIEHGEHCGRVDAVRIKRWPPDQFDKDPVFRREGTSPFYPLEPRARGQYRLLEGVDGYHSIWQYVLPTHQLEGMLRLKTPMDLPDTWNDPPWTPSNLRLAWSKTCYGWSLWNEWAPHLNEQHRKHLCQLIMTSK